MENYTFPVYFSKLQKPNSSFPVYYGKFPVYYGKFPVYYEKLHFLYVDSWKERFVNPDDVYRSHRLPRVRPEDVKTFTAHPHYKFKRFVGFMP